MDEKFEKKLKSFLPYIIIIGLVFMLAPALLFIDSGKEKAGFITYFVLIGVLPLTAAGCCAHYSMKKGSDLLLCLVAPIFFIPAMFLYGIVQSTPLNAIIYLVAYLLCSYLGLTVGEILSSKSKKKSAADQKAGDEPRKTERKPAERKPAERRAPERRSSRRSEDADTPARGSSARPDRVDLDITDDFFTEDPYADESLDTKTTSEDIDEILSEIHQRRDF